MRKRYVVRLSEEERARLRTLVGSGRGAARTLAHARILLKADQGEGGPGWTDAAIAGALEVGLATVARVRQAYATAGLAAALTRKAPERAYARKGRRRPTWSPSPAARRPRAAGAGACASWPSGCSRWRSRTASRTRRSAAS
jgi:hypothetical protein